MLGLELLAERPNFQILPRAIQSIERRLAVLLYAHAKLRLKPIRRFVPYEHQITPCLWHAHANARLAFRLFG